MNFLRNAWYCAGFSHDLGEAPLAVRILDEPLVLYRTQGTAVACLHDRCPHRFAPLSKGRVCGENIECPYHGLQFGADGSCKHNPWGDHSLPKAARVRRYPVAERDMLLWVWMGDPERPNEKDLLDLKAHLNLAHHPVVHGSCSISAHYELVTDNLMDLSHSIYMHGGSLSNGQAHAGKLEVEVKQEGNAVAALHCRANELPAPVFKASWSRSERVDHHSNMYWNPPANLVHDVSITVPGGNPQDGIHLHIAHLLTPESAMKTRYHWIASRNFDIESTAVSESLYGAFTRAFTQEDEPMIAAVQERMGTTDLMSLKPVLLVGDASGMRARRILEKLRKQETEGNSGL